MPSALLAKASELYAAYAEPATEVARTAFHYGFIPLVILLGMRTEPRPTLLALIQPM
eukprot:CAMPEP_0119414906 /NCGR_PEP_ID=MMETSP1335-20130426/7237_1 /TAXON_ID=259385 /ORGANISM="Chrysoculter rhomboideus, Strain RCC1486" /LENGTH=56 /DNA_ID=CAMNT_0007439801 /DNA_START=24 /DNA_END=194 /DNA_ORIENTATION=-